jgi:hypothetical protein
VLPIREFKCPHCFNLFSRPPEWIGRLLPRTSGLNLKTVSRSVRKAEKRAETSSDNFTRRIFRMLSNLGKATTQLEEAIGAGLKNLLRLFSPKAWKRNRSRSKRSRRERSED